MLFYSIPPPQHTQNRKPTNFSSFHDKKLLFFPSVLILSVILLSEDYFYLRDLNAFFQSPIPKRVLILRGSRGEAGGGAHRNEISTSGNTPAELKKKISTSTKKKYIKIYKKIGREKATLENVDKNRYQI